MISVIMPVYNGEKYLVPCLASLYEETRAEIKVIVVDNGSKDDSLLCQHLQMLGRGEPLAA